ncbi:hypothetical protein Hsero_0869 [Herbaspirillum seropedicae SmR1]|uniref:Uncharacterized protein n=1 Tax=Herbaspirillum seropedicae (strain SmR1) TaxID=757424 RepID=D8J050_HERSS|nr:hypothetical protein Hsero_0869 [Herbaspirillum seropedicae SmR1]
MKSASPAGEAHKARAGTRHGACIAGADDGGKCRSGSAGAPASDGKALQFAVICRPDGLAIAEYRGLIREKRPPSVLYYRALVPPDGSCILILRQHAFHPDAWDAVTASSVSPAGLWMARLPAFAIDGPPGKKERCACSRSLPGNRNRSCIISMT